MRENLDSMRGWVKLALDGINAFAYLLFMAVMVWTLYISNKTAADDAIGKARDWWAEYRRKHQKPAPTPAPIPNAFMGG